MKGIDISSYQANMSATAMNAFDFVILKIADGRTKDWCFDTFYSKAKIPVGAFVYSYATTEERAREEALKAIEFAQGKKLPLGIYIDIEEQSQLDLRDSVLTAVVKAFCDTIKSNGYLAGAYGSNDNLWGKVGAAYLGEDVMVWNAFWRKSEPSVKCDIWQTGVGKISGYGGDVDKDVGMSERFAALVNGEPSPEPSPEPKPTPDPQPDAPAVDTFTLACVPVLRKGDVSNAVMAMQGELLALGYSCGGKRKWCGHEVADGIFGNVTEESVRSFQRSRNLPDNGIVGPKTRAALLGI